MEKYSFGVNLYFDSQINLHTHKYFILMSIIRNVENEIEKNYANNNNSLDFYGRKIIYPIELNDRTFEKEEDIIRYQSFSMNESIEDTCTRIHLVFLLIFRSKAND